jgi:hypothetical protein
MVTGGSIYFLSRPRRFGKSLLVSTLDALFSGQKDLFEGLFIYDKWDWSQQYPIIRIDWTLIGHSTPKEMKTGLCRYLHNIARRYKIELQERVAAPDCFNELITLLYEKTGKKVVVLIDEYDKPITGHLLDSHLKTIRTAVHDFYQVMKGADEYLRFIFLTGVSKFSGLSVFSALNNINDITLDWNYCSICGYTQDELENCFTGYIDTVAQYNNMGRSELLNKIKTWYNGYSWDGRTSVYNPFSTLLFLDKREFGNYWFRTGTPTFLIDILQSRNQIKPLLEYIETDSNAFDTYDPDSIGEIPLLFQTGYLTVKQKSTVQEQTTYTLGIPNMEVQVSFTKYLLNAYSKYPVEQLQPLIFKMQRQIYDGDTSALEQNLRMLLANIPNTLHIEKEAYYHSMFLLLMKMLGFDIHGEVLTNIGRIDAVWIQSGLTVIAEVKYHSQKDIDILLDEAITQILDRKYYEAYLDRKVRLLAIAFTGKEVKCRMENIND